MMNDGLLNELANFYDTFHEEYRKMMDEELNNFVKDTWDKGIFQCIGFKEFRNFLQLDREVRNVIDDPKTKKTVEKGVELLGCSNRQYARRQNKWIKYRCLVNDRDTPPLYKLDVTNLEQWASKISPLALHIVENFLHNRKPTLLDVEPKIEPKFRGNLRLNRKCDVCEGKIMNGIGWDVHEKSWAHRQNLRKRKKLLEEVCQTLDFLLEGVSICQTIYRKKSVGDITALPFIMCCTNCFFWLIYGFLKNERTIINVNIVGFALQLSYVLFYYAYAKHKRIVNLQVVCAIVFSCLGLAHVKFSGYSMQSLIDHTGSVCLLLNVLNFASPLVTLKEVLNRKSTESISFALCAANLLVSAQWFLYGILVDDIYMKVPNFLGLILTLVQLSLFAMYPLKSSIGRSKK
uniref:Sugar transporter SWEET1 n=1 Tax=Romanomermis culicivorax TaxID=13658 RepID=A0A915IRN3_ROMCU